MMNDNEWISPAEAARLVGRTRARMGAYMKKGQIKFVERGGRKFIHISEVKRLKIAIDSYRQSSI